MMNPKNAITHLFTANSVEQMVAHDPSMESVARFFTFPAHLCVQNTFEEDGTPLTETKWLSDVNYQRSVGVVVDHVQQNPATPEQMQTLRAFSKMVMEQGQPRTLTEELHQIVERIDSAYADGISYHSAHQLIRQIESQTGGLEAFVNSNAIAG